MEPNKKSLKNRSVIGFLYSISNGGVGEYWPLSEGQNKIGRSAENDIQLKEGTVAEKHANISIKKNYPTGKLVASLQSLDPDTCILLNGEKIGSETVFCKNGDLLTLGENYQLLVILVDAASFGLSVADHFVSVDGNAKSQSPNIYRNQGGLNLPRRNGMFDPYSAANRRFVESSSSGENKVSSPGEIASEVEESTVIM